MLKLSKQLQSLVTYGDGRVRKLIFCEHAEVAAEVAEIALEDMSLTTIAGEFPLHSDDAVRTDVQCFMHIAANGQVEIGEALRVCRDSDVVARWHSLTCLQHLVKLPLAGAVTR